MFLQYLRKVCQDFAVGVEKGEEGNYWNYLPAGKEMCDHMTELMLV